MKKYFEYMNDRMVSDTLHHRLLNLETPKKRPAAWKKYGAAAAALALVVGVGAWGLSRGGWGAVTANFRPAAASVDEPGGEVAPEGANVDQPDIALVEPGDEVEPGMKTDGGYEISDGEVVSYFMLPYIEYGMTDNITQMSLDWDLPKGSTRRDLTQADIDALFGGGSTLSDHLAWGGYELTGWAGWLEDGSFWGFYLYGHKGPLDHFEFALAMGNTYPPSCIGYLDGVVNDLWGVPVTAYGHGGPNGCDRRVEFLNHGYGFRFDMTGSDVEQTSHLVSRVTRWMLSDGLMLDAITPDGAVLVHPWEADPNYSVGEPNWEDGVSDYDSDCPYCADGTVHTHPYDPNEVVDPSYNAPN